MTEELRLADCFPRARTLGKRLLETELTVAAAESCTGGLLGAAMTAVPGSSRYMRGAVVAYANDVKTALLDVDTATLERLGAVSAEVAGAMAAGVAHRLQADLGLAITGVAGPGNEGSDKPVGVIFVAGCLRGTVEVVELREGGDREANRAAAVAAALALGERMVEAQ